MDGLKIPASEGVRLLPIVGGASGAVVAVTAVRGRTANQLQAFHVSAGRSWDSVRLELLARVRRNGGTAEEFIGRSGPGVQARVPVVTSEGASKVQDVRFVGLDGPGWLLRGAAGSRGGLARGVVQLLRSGRAAPRRYGRHLLRQGRGGAGPSLSPVAAGPDPHVAHGWNVSCRATRGRVRLRQLAVGRGRLPGGEGEPGQTGAQQGQGRAVDSCWRGTGGASPAGADAPVSGQ
ncbi:DUF3710 domain-containing protein [Streptomyces olivochromogenes]|uniref:DUF3710 domain-containing protein n=1 Tax=Streptomyces olivochromogenes TaxID=1963 RepID=UPI0036C190BD